MKHVHRSADIQFEDNVVPHVAMYIRCASHRIMAFLAWEKKYIDTGYFVWGNDIYQWNNVVRGAG